MSLFPLKFEEVLSGFLGIHPESDPDMDGLTEEQRELRQNIVVNYLEERATLADLDKQALLKERLRAVRARRA